MAKHMKARNVRGFTLGATMEEDTLRRALDSLPKGFCRNPFKRKYEYEQLVDYDVRKGWKTDGLRHWRCSWLPKGLNVSTIVLDICENKKTDVTSDTCEDNETYDISLAICFTWFGTTSDFAWITDVESQEQVKRLLREARRPK